MSLSGTRPDLFIHLRLAAEPLLESQADPAMAWNNLERVAPHLHLDSDPHRLLTANSPTLGMLLQLLSTSQWFADTLANDPRAVGIALDPPGRNPSMHELHTRLRASVDAAPDDAAVLRAFRRFRQLEVLRIGINDVIRDRPLDEITRDLSRVADVALDVAIQTAMRSQSRKLGCPTTASGKPARLAALAFGKLGGDELNYSSDIDLMFVFDEPGTTTGKRSPVGNGVFFVSVVQEVIRLLSSHTADGFAYRIDLRLRPEGKTGPLVRPVDETRSYYDVMGRTWERQALIKLRPCAGDLELGREFHTSIESFVYRKYFSFSEINEVKMLKRQMEQRASRSGDDDRDVKTGRGGIRDIEYAIQFLQLLNGGDLPAVRQRNTLLALEALEIAGCLTPNETYILADAYRFLRKTEHRLQLLFDLQTHRLPESPDELRKLALRMGYTERNLAPVRIPPPESGLLLTRRSSWLDEIPESPPLEMRSLLIDPLDWFLQDLREKTQADRRILDHLLHETFSSTTGQQAEPEADLILAPDADPATIQRVLGRYPFSDLPRAYQNLSRLAVEGVRFLSSRRCRHFFASIAPQLLRAVAQSPDPDLALERLEHVTTSLGAKAVLYELFSSNPATLKLYVDLCANSPFLSGLLINNPGMVDELLDTLVLDQPRTVEDLQRELTELLRGATDPAPILHSFQDKEFLRVGVTDLLGSVSVRETTANLSDVAEAILNAAFGQAEATVQERYGVPMLDDSPHAGPCRYAVVGLGKLGGREISYHSDLDVMVVYEADGNTQPHTLTARSTTNQHYFTELLQKAIQTLSQQGPLGRLYIVDLRLRPTGRSGALVLPVSALARYFREGGGQLWERQAFTRGRVLRAEMEFGQKVEEALHHAMTGTSWQPTWRAEIVAMRARLEQPPGNIKRGAGGLTDVEFLVQAFQLRFGREVPAILKPNVWDALHELRAARLLSEPDAELLLSGYSFLRTVESRLRIVTDRSLVTVPESLSERMQLAKRLGFTGPDAVPALEERLRNVMQQNRELFLRLLPRSEPTQTS